jgi:hypothetical protein
MLTLDIVLIAAIPVAFVAGAFCHKWLAKRAAAITGTTAAK